MDNKQVIEQFEKIENKVEELITNCKHFEAENIDLKDKIKELYIKLQAKEEAESRYAEERNLIGLKINELLTKLDNN